MPDDSNIKKGLRPLSKLYGWGVSLRNKLFDKGTLKSEQFPVPVISIGNLTVGGTGKTPHTEYLIRLLSKKYKVAVLSRGYKRKTAGFHLANAQSTAQTIGDEPFQMFRKFPEVTVAVDGNRRRGIKRLLELPANQRPEIILLDDAYQHRYVMPSLSILLTSCQRLFSTDELLPAGRLREPAENSHRANIVICTKCPAVGVPLAVAQQIPLTPQQQLYFSSYEYKGLLPVFPDSTPVKKENLEHLQKEGYSLLMVAGLAQPEDMIAYLKEYTTDLQPLLFPDHRDFSKKDLALIAANYATIKNEKKLIITSEKDAVRLMDSPLVPEALKSALYYLPIRVAFCNNQEKLFIQQIENHVTNFKGNRSLA
ncbi:MAG: tetraacyldisaccharide 4'-kinase [Candidatus Symbiothrix sp.]|jgi:tetraacyldisaccharide 4'-kinase|nr:tetraacyldisaccharide 4'-kinase [Candidatus Symbiothrix sp.]